MNSLPNHTPLKVSQLAVSYIYITLPFAYFIHLMSFHLISLADVPWSWDRRYNKKDVYGQVWPRHVQLYATQES